MYNFSFFFIYLQILENKMSKKTKLTLDTDFENVFITKRKIHRYRRKAITLPNQGTIFIPDDQPVLVNKPELDNISNTQPIFNDEQFDPISHIFETDHVNENDQILDLSYEMENIDINQLNNNNKFRKKEE